MLRFLVPVSFAILELGLLPPLLDARVALLELGLPRLEPHQDKLAFSAELVLTRPFRVPPMLPPASSVMLASIQAIRRLETFQPARAASLVPGQQPGQARAPNALPVPTPVQLLLLLGTLVSSVLLVIGPIRRDLPRSMVATLALLERPLQFSGRRQLLFALIATPVTFLLMGRPHAQHV